MKKYKNGLVLGKFMPPHNGHLFLIDTAISQCETVHVMVCSEPNQPISGQLRWQWLSEIYHFYPNVNIIWCDDENPQYPNECKSVDIFYQRYWVPSVYNRIKELDAVFTSEDYGDEFADYLNVEHVCVDQPRILHKVSGTLIRNDPHAYWEYIPKVVRPYFTKKVVIMGPESTGKSTLGKRLAAHYNTSYVEEYGRTYTEKTPYQPITQMDFTNIAKGHKSLVDKAIAKGEKIIFVDTEAITTKVFGEMYVKGFDSTEIDKYIKEQQYDLYLLLDIDVPWIDDGTRIFPEHRASHLTRLKAVLEENDIKYTMINGTYENRYHKAINEINNLFPRAF